MNRCLFTMALTVCLCLPSQVPAQQVCVTYKLVPQTVYKTRPVNLSSMINETVMESKQVVTYKPVWTKETRQRKTTVYKPIVTTSEREERYLVRRPIIETSYREREIQETSYETVTEMTEKRYLVETPVVETQMREEEVVVRKPVTTTVMQSENVTTYKPTTVSETQYVAGANVSNQLFLEGGRNRLRWLKPGVYVDPLTGYAGYRGRGLHWSRDQNLVLRPTIEPTLIPQQVLRTTYTPETVTVQKPVQVTQYVDQIEKRQVPVQVNTTSKKIHVVQIPVTVQKPVTKVRTEKIPVQEVKYREEIYTRKVPVTETKFQKVEQVEPYDVEVCKWVTETSEIQVPKTVCRRVNYSVDQVYPVTNWIRVPVDAYGNALSAGEIVATEVHPAIDYQVANRITSAPITKVLKPEPTSPAESLETANPEVVVGKPIVVRKLDDDEYRQPTEKEADPKSILVPESQTDPSAPATDTVVVKKVPSSSESNESSGEDEATDENELDPAPTPTSPDDAAKSLDVEPADDSDIGTRPGTNNSDDDLNLNGAGN